MKNIIIFFYIIFLNTAYSQVWEGLIKSSEEALSHIKTDSCLVYLEQALTLAIKESPAKHSVTLNRLGNYFFTLGQPEKAFEYYITEKNLEKSIFGKNHPLYAKTVNNISVCLMLLGRYQEAETNLKEDLEIKKSVYGTNDTNYAKTLHNLGKLYQTMGNYQDAERYYLEAIDIKNNQAGEKSVLSANTALNLGILYASLNNTEEAQKYLKKAYVNYEDKLGDRSLQTNLALIQLALINETSGNSEEANIFIKHINIPSISTDSEILSIDLPTVLYDYGILLIKKGKFADAEKILEQTLKLIEKQFGKTSSSYVSCLNSMGICYSIEGKNEQALKYFNQVATLREVFFGETHPEYSISLFNIAFIYDKLNQPEQAELYYTKGIEATQKLVLEYFPFLSESEKENYYYNLWFRYNLFINFTINLIKEKPQLAALLYDFHLATKDILLNNMIKLRNSIEESNNKDLQGLYDSWKKLRTEMTAIMRLSKNELKTCSHNPDSIQKLINVAEKQLSIRTKSAGIEHFNQKICFKDIKEHLLDSEAAVEIIKFDISNDTTYATGYCTLSNTTGYCALILTKQSQYPDFVLIDKEDALESKAIKNYENSIRSKINDNDSYHYFWSAIANKLKGIRKVYISSDGVYHKLNLGTLITPNNNYLIDELQIVNLNSTSGIINLKKKIDISLKTSILFGNPSFSELPDKSEKLIDYVGYNVIKEHLETLKISDLPGTAKEVELVKEILSQSGFNTYVFLANKASKSEFIKAKKEGIIHIATHGYFLNDPTKEFSLLQMEENKNPMFRSGLFFKGADFSQRYSGFSDNGILSSYEVTNLDLTHSDLVVLSACETGLGEIKNGEGVYGLRRAFQIAGAKNLILSLWKVNDEATQKLFVAFYRNLLKSYDADSALREAQLELKREFENPYYWGAFILVRN